MKQRRLRRRKELLGCLLLIFWGITRAAISVDERAALDSLFKSTNGASWLHNENWEGPIGTECTWTGLTCDSGQAHVTSINLHANNLDGTLPASLSSFSQLESFDVSTNKLTGSLPSLSGLVQLRYFSATTNKLSGSIPSLQGLAELEYFDIESNATPIGCCASVVGTGFTGPIPNLSSLSKLQHFGAALDAITGPIPSLSGLKDLSYFNVTGNYLTGTIPSLSGLTNLTVFLVGSNQLTGGIPSLAGLKNLSVFHVYYNQLGGELPDLAELTNLSYLDAVGDQLTGRIPSLSGLTNLYAFVVQGNQLSGSIPSLAGLDSLQYFDVSINRLTGTVPDLSALSNLAFFSVFDNGLSGQLPKPPTALLPGSSGAGKSLVCNNAFDHTESADWDTATGISPWYRDCTLVPPALAVSTADTNVDTGTSTRVSVAAPPSSGKATSVSSATVTDTLGRLVCYMTFSNDNGSCDVVLPSGNNTLTIAYSGTASLSASSVQFSKTIPVATPGNLNQQGWTGTWYNPATGGQGIVFEIYPDLLGSGTGLLGGGWFTYDTVAGGEESKRWYTLSGQVLSTSPSAQLDVIATKGGNFNAGPVITAANGKEVVGNATINFTDCTHGAFTYRFSTPEGRKAGVPDLYGSFPLSRLDSNVTCDATNGSGNGAAPGKFLLSGAWFDPNTSGQGLLFDINPKQGLTFAAWYTFAPNGQAVGGGASQRWYTLQIGSANVGATPLTGISIYSAQGGTLNVPGGVTTPQVGNASIAFGDCNHLVLTYAFDAGTNAGRNGQINLVRVGPTPAGCSVQ